MPVRVFSNKEKEELRRKMLEAGYPLLKQYGMTHMSVDKITKAAQIGKSTFYNFFESKEEYIAALLEHNKATLFDYFTQMTARRKLERKEVEQLLNKLLKSENNLFKYLSATNESDGLAVVKENEKEILEKETDTLKFLVERMNNVKENPDYPLIANLSKSLALMDDNRDMFYESHYEAARSMIMKLLLDCIFDDDNYASSKNAL